MVPATNRLIGLVTATGVVVLARAFAVAVNRDLGTLCEAGVGVGNVVRATDGVVLEGAGAWLWFAGAFTLATDRG